MESTVRVVDLKSHAGGTSGWGMLSEGADDMVSLVHSLYAEAVQSIVLSNNACVDQIMNKNQEMKELPCKGLTHLLFPLRAFCISTYSAGLIPFFLSLCIFSTLRLEVSTSLLVHSLLDTLPRSLMVSPCQGLTCSDIWSIDVRLMMRGTRAGMVGGLLEALLPVPVDALLEAGERAFCELDSEPWRDGCSCIVGIGVCCFSLPLDREVTNFREFVRGADHRC